MLSFCILFILVTQQVDKLFKDKSKHCKMRSSIVIALSMFLGTMATDHSCLTPILLPTDNITDQPAFTDDSMCSVRPSVYQTCKFSNSQNLGQVLRSFMRNQGSLNDLFYYSANSNDGILEYSCVKANVTYGTDENGRVVFTVSVGSITGKYTEMESGAFELWVNYGCYYKHFKSFAFPTCVNGILYVLDCRLDKDDEVDASLLGRFASLYNMTDADVAHINSEFPLLNFYKNACDQS